MNQKLKLKLDKTSFVDHLLRCKHCSQNVHCITNLGYFQHLFHSVQNWYDTIIYPILILFDICHLLYLLCLYFLSLQVKTTLVDRYLLLYIIDSDHSKRLEDLYFLYFISFLLINPASTTIPDSHSLVIYECELLTLLLSVVV